MTQWQSYPVNAAPAQNDTLLENDVSDVSASAAGTVHQVTIAAVLAAATVATTGTAGYTLVNGTGTILTWTAPSDGALHAVEVIGITGVTSLMTGGQVNVTYTDAAGNAQNAVLTAAGLAAGTTAFNNALNRTMIALPPGGTVSVTQATALTAGAAKVYAMIRGA